MSTRHSLRSSRKAAPPVRQRLMLSEQGPEPPGDAPPQQRPIHPQTRAPGGLRVRVVPEGRKVDPLEVDVADLAKIPQRMLPVHPPETARLHSAPGGLG